MKKAAFLLSFIFSVFIVFSQTEIDPAINKSTFTFANKDSLTLKLDKYRLKETENQQACILFVFGGGFINGSRDDKNYNDYFNFLTKQGFTVISIDYRLGLKGQKGIGPLNYKPLKAAIKIAVEDLFDATSFAINHAGEWKIDTSRFIISGSSAGAITVLQAEYENRNKYASSQKLPLGFQYAGVISFAGGIFSTDGGLKWKENQPCPMMLFHGEEDKTVPYNKIRFFKLGMFGSKTIAGKLKKEKTPYWFLSFKNSAHEIANTPMHDNHEEILYFINTYVLEKQRVQNESKINLIDKEKPKKNSSYKDLYK